MTALWKERTVEVYEQQAVALAQALALSLSPHRPGFDHTLSLPLGRLRGLRMSLRRRRMAHVFIAEEGYLKWGLKRRVLRLLWQPPTVHSPLRTSVRPHSGADRGWKPPSSRRVLFSRRLSPPSGFSRTTYLLQQVVVE